MQTTLGAQKMWARRQGISLEEYLQKISKGLKRCIKCKGWKPLNNFAKDRSRKDGLHTKCKLCHARPLPHKTTVPPSMRKKLRKRMKGNKLRCGIPLSKEHKEILRQKAIEQKRFVGSNSPQWKGGITPENHIMRNNSDYHQWRTKIFKKDQYTCQHCGDNKGGNLEAHHIREWYKYKELRYDVSNGITVCRNCHAKIHDKPDSYRKRRKVRRLLKTQ